MLGAKAYSGLILISCGQQHNLGAELSKRDELESSFKRAGDPVLGAKDKRALQRSAARLCASWRSRCFRFKIESECSAYRPGPTVASTDVPPRHFSNRVRGAQLTPSCDYLGTKGGMLVDSVKERQPRRPRAGIKAGDVIVGTQDRAP